MFSAKLYVKYPQSTVKEQRENDIYVGKYSADIPCDIFMDEALTQKIGHIDFEFRDLDIPDCTPEYIYSMVLSKFNDTVHIS